MRRKKNNIKMGLTFVVLLFFLASLSVSYAMWTEDTQINGTISTMEDFNYLCMEGYWPLDKTTGTTAPDISMGQNHGTVNGATWTPGSGINGCLSFDGDDDYVSIPDDNSLDITEKITIIAWVYADSWDNSGASLDVCNIVDKGEHESSYGYDLYSYNSGTAHKLHFRLNKDSSADVSCDLPSTGNWHHIAATYDGAILKIYIDSVKTGELAYTGSIATNDQPLYIGNGVNRDYWFDGLIDEVKIYSCALSDNDILDDYNLSIPI